MKIREFTLDDYDSVLALWALYPDALGLGRSDTRDEIAKKLAYDPALFILAEEGGRVVGTVLGGFDGRRGLIYHLAVHPDFGGRGLGRSLMEEIERRLVARGCLRAYLLVRPENSAVIDWYEQIGWEPLPLTIMAKSIS